MADVKWIKITTDIFDDEKILLIESLPSADSILVIWFKLLVLAGKQNNNGVFMMNDRLAYTDEMLAVIFRRDVNTIRLALRTFEQYGMIEIVENVITIPKWSKHQTLDAYEKKKERDRLYQEKRRAEQKLLAAGGNRPVSRLTENEQTDEQSSCVAVSEEEIDKDKDIDKRKNISKKPTRHKYGDYSNVLLSDDDLAKLKAEFPADWENRIQRLSEYMASSGKSYKNHLATIRNWARRDKPAKAKPAGDMDDLDGLF